MSVLHFAEALLPEGWARDVRVEIEGGRIAGIAAGVAARPGDAQHAAGVPGLPNLHSHAFQRGMAGLAERRGTGEDSFWTWRQVMYRFLEALTPEDVEAIAALAYAEMLEAGFTRVGEFHYLHHAPDGARYARAGEMAERIAAAAAETGIGLTLLPVLYAHGDFGGAPPSPAQRRFVADGALFARLVEDAASAVAGLPGGALGVAPHSLRAVSPAGLAECVALAAGRPVHIHVAEQMREVEACLAWSGARPVAWLLDHAPVGPGWCVVHATHMDAAEAARLARSGAVAGLCPVTEANLGDGIFDAARWRGLGGAWGVGSDSNVRIDAAEELRLLEYAQRLVRRERNVLADAGASSGRGLFEAALAGGAAALGVTGGLQVGGAADLVALDVSHPSLWERGGDRLLDGWIFAGGRAGTVWRNGREVVRDGRHVARPAIERAYRRTLARLLAE